MFYCLQQVELFAVCLATFAPVGHCTKAIKTVKSLTTHKLPSSSYAKETTVTVCDKNDKDLHSLCELFCSGCATYLVWHKGHSCGKEILFHLQISESHHRDRNCAQTNTTKPN